jgi:hypothetical protein
MTVIEKVTVHGYRKGAWFVVTGRNGEAVGRFSLQNAAKPTSDAAWSIAWNKRIDRMLNSFQKQSRTKVLSGWDAKPDTWLASLSRRRSDRRPCRVPKLQRFNGSSRQSWEQAITCLLHQSRNESRRAAIQKRDKWWVWSETVSRNFRSREDFRNGNKSRASESGRGTGVQMRWDFN